MIAMSIESIFQKALVGKRIQLYRAKIKHNGDKKRKIPVSYTIHYFTKMPEIVGNTVKANPVKGDILSIRVVGENDYDSQEMMVIIVRPLRSSEMVEITITSMTENFAIVK